MQGYSKHDMKAKAERDTAYKHMRDTENVPSNNVELGSATERSLNELAGKRDQLTGMLNILFDRLDPVLHPQSNSVEKESPMQARPIAGQVVSSITCECDMLQTLCVRLDVLLSRMEI